MADFSISAELKANASQFVSELKKGGTSVNNFGGVVEKILGPKGKLVSALAAATTAAVKFGQAMNSSMSEIAKGTGKTGEELYKLRENVHDALVDGVARSAKEVGTMIADLNTRFGVTGKEVVQLTKDFDKFAKVTDTDTKTAINLTADAMAKWNIQTEDTDKLLDQLTKASQESGASVTELLNGLKSGQAVFSQFGMSATDTIAFMGALKQNGIESSQALIAMKTALANFANDGINAQEGFAQVSEAIKNATSQTEALSIATATFGARNGAEMVKVLQSGALSADEFKNKLMEAGGAVESTHKAARTSKEAIAELGSALSGTFGGLAEGLESLFKGIVDVIKRAIQMIDPIVRPLMNIVRDVLSFVGELVAEIANLIGDSVENGLGFNMVASSLQSAYETIHDILANLLEVFKNAFSLISHVMGGQWDVVLLDFEKGFLLFAKTILDYVSDLLNGFKGQINVFIEKVINPFIEKVNFVEEKLGRKKTDKMSLIENFDLSGTTGLTQKIDEITKKIQDKTGETAKKMTGDLGAVKKAIKDTGDEAEKENKEVASETSKTLKNFVTGMKSGLKKIGGEYNDIIDNTEALNTVLYNVGETVVNVVAVAFEDTFTALGEELVAGGNAWENMTAIALDGVAQVLQALGQQLLALSAARAANYDYGTAAMAAAGAAAAFVASGAISAVASQMKEAADEAANVVSSINTLKQKLNEIKNQASFESMYSDMNRLNSLLDEANNKLIIAEERLEKYKPLMTFAKANIILMLYEKELNTALKEVELIENEIKSYYLSVINNLQEVNKEIENQIGYYTDLYNVSEDLYNLQNVLSGTFTWDSFDSETSFQKYKIMIQQQTNSIKESILSVFNEFSTIGTTLGENIVNGIIDGTTKQDFASQLKTYLRENMIKLAVYTDEFSEKLGQSSTNFIIAMNTKNADLLTTTRKELEALWDSAQLAASEAESFIDSVFGDIQENVESVIESAEEMGSSIADSLIDGLSNGLSQADFLETMKSYIKKLVVTSVVYTESLQAEISAIGEAISNGIKEGFSETGLEEIRRDLSYIWYNANNAVSAIDSVLNNVFTGYATGTDNATAGLHLVGEAGPELVRFRGGEQVFNANETRNMLQNGNGGNNFNVTFNNMQDTSAYAMLQQMKQWQREMAINGII